MRTNNGAPRGGRKSSKKPPQPKKKDEAGYRARSDQKWKQRDDALIATGPIKRPRWGHSDSP